MTIDTVNGDSARVTLQNGQLIGRQEAGYCVWLGIPYAEPPTGPLRWRAPVAASSWSGVRAATVRGASCPQWLAGWIKAKRPLFDEDCLHLNIWSPAADAKRRPVIVWIHGGGFSAGSADPYEGAHLAVLGDIVVVTLNYRLGVFGFVNFKDVTGADDVDGNLGLRDQIIALEWVRDNIAAFGGDPQQVTVAGHSAGSIAVSLLMLCAQARPLFHRVILQSGVSNLIHEAATSVQVAQLYTQVLGNDIQRLRELDVTTLLKAQQQVDKSLPGLLPASPWFDGIMLPSDFAAARLIPTPDIPMLAGTTQDEIRLFELRPGPDALPLRRSQFTKLMHGQLGKIATERILAFYPDSRAGTRRLGTDAVFCMPTIQLAQRHALKHPTWLYRFDAGHPWFGAVHGLDYLYLWRISGIMAFLLRGGRLRGRRAALALRMQHYWVSFVRTGVPADDWPLFQAPHYPTLIFGFKDKLVDNPEAARLNAWKGQAIVPASSARDDTN